MAEVFRRAKGRKLEGIIARHKDVQNRLDDLALEHGVRAEANLKAHEDTGASYVEVEDGDVDRYVVLNDERGLGAAMSIEFGRHTRLGRTTPVWALHDAFGLEHD